jgi:SRSO17 transposase
VARKSIAPMALAVAGRRLRRLPRLLRETVGDEAQRRWHSPHLVADEVGTPDGVLLCDDSGVGKKGHASVGVARQYGGTLGKVENGQVGVCAG